MDTTRRPAFSSHRVRLVVACLGVLLLGLGAVPAGDASATGSTPRPGTGFSSSFNIHHNGWTVLSGVWEHAGSAVFRTEGMPEKVASIARTGRFGDFTYEVRMKRVGCATCANRLVIRGRVDPTVDLDFAPSFFFQYSNEAPGGEGMFAVFKIKADGSSIAVKGWTYTPAVIKEGWNVLKVEAVGNYFHFYINGALVWEGSRSGLSTGRVGISMYRGSDGTGDDFRVDWARLTLGSTLAPGLVPPTSAGAVVPGDDADRSPGA